MIVKERYRIVKLLGVEVYRIERFVRTWFHGWQWKTYSTHVLLSAGEGVYREIQEFSSLLEASNALTRLKAQECEATMRKVGMWLPL